ncbi:thioesterase family protein [candidate division KSB1 bacterium]|nr:thioesterase family protein [candidate division KSB1 bacterium]
MHDTDAAGLLFYSSIFNIIHDAYEAFMDSHDLNIGKILKEKIYMLPIVRAEADYKLKQTVGDEMTIILTCEKVGKSSFTINYKILNSENEIACTAKTVNVVLEYNTKEITAIPQKLREALISL